MGRGYQICPINGKIDHAPTIFIVPAAFVSILLVCSICFIIISITAIPLFRFTVLVVT